MARKTVSFEMGDRASRAPYLSGGDIHQVVNHKDPIDLIIEQIERQVEKKRNKNYS